MTSDRTQRNIKRAAQLIAKADALLITAGAGMSVDSGLPDFRGGQGFWRAYPPLEKLQISFEEMAQPHWFDSQPEMAWAFYGHRQQLYRDTKPHMGYWMLRDWARAVPAGYFVVTSNVDGAFEAAGFAAERILEQHGNIHRYQCTAPCSPAIWTDDAPDLQIDLATLQARGPLPRCPECGALARPNVLMFGDFAWVADAMEEQRRRYQQWLASVRGKQVVIVEIGAGTALATIRWFGEKLTGERPRTTLVRINPDAGDADEPALPVRMTALEALTRIEEKLPESFKAAAKAGVRIERPTAAILPVSPRGGLEPLPPEHLDTIEFFESITADVPPAWLSAAPKASDALRHITYLDLDTGQTGPFNHLGISSAEESVCLESWYGPQKDKYAPLPEVAGQSAPGFLLTGRAVRAGEPVAGRRPGAVIMHLCDVERNVVVTFGVARRPLEGAQLWRLLYEEGVAPVTAKPLDFPRVPWVARRLGPAAKEHIAMLPVLAQIERAMAWTWLRLMTYYEQQKREDRDG